MKPSGAHRLGRAAPLLSVALLVWACEDDPVERGLEIVERDSAGVTIVENPPLDEAAEFARVDPIPLVEIGSLDGPADYQLYLVRDAHRYPDGRLAIANGGSHEVRFYDEDGRYLHAVGGQGDGPGEFQNVASLWSRPGDTLWAYDSRHRSFTVLDPTGTFVRTATIRGEGVFFPNGVFEDGAVLGQAFQVFVAGEARAGALRLPVTISVYGPHEGGETPLGEWPGSEMFVSTAGRRMAVRGLVFGRQLFAIVAADRAVIGSSDERAFELVGRDGTVERIARVGGPLDPVPDGAFDRYVEETLATSEGDDLRRMWADLFAGMPRHDTYPAFEALRADSEGRIWMADYRGPGEEVRLWTVFRPDGWMLGRVRTPDGLRLLEIGDDYIIGVSRDELEVERVRVHGLEISSTARRRRG